MVKTAGLQIDVVLSHSCLLGEGPVWDAEREVICWIDILQGEIHEYSPRHRTHRTISVHQMIGSIAICTNGNFIAGLQHGFGFIDRSSGEVRMISAPEADLPGNRFNEGKCDPGGRFWAGTMPLSEKEPVGSVYVVEKNLSVKKVIEGVTISNGMAWSTDDKTFYYIDTPTFAVVAYDFDRSTGNISNKRTVIKISTDDGYPDGMTIDNEGMLWIAHWDGWQVTRWDPRTGRKLYHIGLPAANATSCTFGGENLDDLYITSAKKGLTDQGFQNQPLAGSLFVVPKCGFKGLIPFKFEV